MVQANGAGKFIDAATNIQYSTLAGRFRTGHPTSVVRNLHLLEMVGPLLKEKTGLEARIEVLPLRKDRKKTNTKNLQDDLLGCKYRFSFCCPVLPTTDPVRKIRIRIGVVSANRALLLIMVG